MIAAQAVRIAAVASAIAAAPAQEPGAAEVIWSARVEAIAPGGTIAEADLVEAMKLHAAPPATLQPRTWYWRYVLARGLARHAGRTLDRGDGTSVAVPDRLALCRAAQAAALASGYEPIRADASLELGDALWEVGDDDAERAFRAVLGLAGGERHCLAWLRLGAMAEHRGDLEQARLCLAEATAAQPTDDSRASAMIRATLRGSVGEFHLILGLVDEAARDFAAEREVLGPTSPTARKRELDLLVIAGRHEEAAARAAAWRAEPDAAAPRTQELYELLEAIAWLGVPELRAGARATLRRLWDSRVAGNAAAARARSALAALEDDDPNEARAALAGLAAPRGWSIRLSALTARAGLALTEADPPPAELEAELDRAVEQLVRQWDRLPPRPGGVGFLQFDQRRRLLSLLVSVRIRRHADGVQRGLAELLRVGDRGSFARRHALASSDVAAALALVPPGGAAVLWLPASIGTHVFVLADGAVHHYAGGDDRPARELGRRFRAKVREPATPGDALRALGLDLRERLFPAGAWQLVAARRSLLVVGGEEWGIVPFEALPGEGAAYLGHSHAIAHVPSVAVGAWLRARATPLALASASLCVAPTPLPEVGAAFGLATLDLPDARLAELFDPWPGVRTTTAPFGAATWRTPPSDYQIVVAHGVHDAQRERPPGLATAAAPGIVWCEDVETGRASRLVTLLACAAAQATRRRGEDGGNHLGAALFAAGADTVLLADEDLELASSLALAHAFHRELAANGPHTPAEALRRARVSVASSAEFAAPAYHALLRVTGSGFTPVAVRPRAANGSRWTTLGLLALAAALGWWLRARVSRRSARPALR